MKLVKLYESALREGAAESCVVEFGKIYGEQFATYNHGRALRPEFIDAIKKLKHCVSPYPEVIHLRGVTYKGDVMSIGGLLDQYEDIEDDLKSGGVFDFTYAPKSIIQNWTSDNIAAENFTKISPFLLQVINSYKNVKDDPKALGYFTKEIYGDLDDISVPIVIEHNSTIDDFLFRSKYFTSLSKNEYKDELLRINNQPTRVTGTIIKSLFKEVFGILKAIKQYEVRVNQ